MSNSSLVSYTKISPNKTSPRNHVIDTITIHVYVGQASVESMGAWFAEKSARCSCNYAIGTDGRIALIVDEKDRSWCSSNGANDNRAITIECASDRTDPYAINDKVYKSLINLCADVCKRNNIKELKWKADKSLIGQVDKQNMTAHRWFANKSCPGEYVYSRLGQIAKEVNAKLGVTSTPAKEESNIKNVVIGDSTVDEISKVVYGEAGIIRSYNSLLGAAQCIHDMLESGQFGKTVTEVMKHNYAAYGTKDTTDEARQAVYDVFVKGKRRFPDAKVLQFRSFTKYSDGNGNMDKSKCADLLKKYTYLGKDARNNQWGHLYFGHKITTETAKTEPKTEPVKTKKPKAKFQVKVSIPYLNIRKGPGTNYAKTGKTTGVGVFGITEVKAGEGSNSGWGKLLSEAGWISLDYATKI